jgi:hypothetical protein
VRKRFVATAVIALLAVSLVPTAPASASTSGPCGLSRASDETVQHFSKRQIRCAVATFGPVTGGVARAVCIARRESDLIPTAESTSGKYLGLYQHAAKAWKTRYKDYTKASWALPTSALKGRTNAVVTIRMVVALGGWKTAGWSPKGC